METTALSSLLAQPARYGVAGIRRSAWLVIGLLAALEFAVIVWLAIVAWQHDDAANRWQQLELHHRQTYRFAVSLWHEDAAQLSRFFSREPIQLQSTVGTSSQQQLLGLQALSGSGDLLVLEDELVRRHQLLETARRQLISSPLGGRVTENALYEWQLAQSGVHDVLEKLFKLHDTQAGGVADRRVAQVLLLRYRLWQLGAMTQFELTIARQQYLLQRPVNTSLQYERQRKRELVEFALRDIREIAQERADSGLSDRVARLGDLLWRLQRLADEQQTRLSSSKLAPNAAMQSDEVLATLSRNVSAMQKELYAYVDDLIEAAVAKLRLQIAMHYGGLLGFGVLMIAANLGLVLFFRRHILRPIQYLLGMFESSRDAMFTLAEDGRILAANHGAAKMFEVPSGHLERMWLSQVFRRDVAASEISEGESSCQGIGVRASGETFFAQAFFSPIKIDGLSQRLVVIHDVHHLRQAEWQMGKNAALLAAIQQIQAMLLVRKPRPAVFREVLRVYMEAVGVQEGLIIALEKNAQGGGEFLQQARQCTGDMPEWLERFCGLPPGMALGMTQHHEVVREDGWCYLLIKADGKTVMVIALHDTLKDADLAYLKPLSAIGGGIVNFFLEEDQRRVCERSWQDAVQSSEALASSVPIALLWLDRKLDIVRSNEAARRLFSRSDEALTGIALAGLFSQCRQWPQLQTALSGLSEDDSVLEVGMVLGQSVANGRSLRLSAVLQPMAGESQILLACVDLSQPLQWAAGTGLVSLPQLAMVISRQQDAMAFFDANGELLSCNALFLRLIGQEGNLDALLGLPYPLVMAALPGWVARPGCWPFTDEISDTVTSLDVSHADQALLLEQHYQPAVGALCILRGVPRAVARHARSFLS